MFLAGFREDNHGNTQINKPIWRLLDNKAYGNLENRPYFCKMDFYEDEALDISVDKNKKLPVINQFFILSEKETDVFRKPALRRVKEGTSLASDYVNEQEYDIQYATTNIITQTTLNFGIIGRKLSQTSQTTSTNDSSERARATREAPARWFKRGMY